MGNIDIEKPFPILVYITNNITKETRIYNDIGYLDEGEFFNYIWSEGNFKCDCNRGIFFNKDDETKEECGNEKYSIKITNNCGKILYDETVAVV